MDLKDYECPRCGGDVPNADHKGEYPGALSRHEQGVEICSACGTDESVRYHVLGPRWVLDRDDWFDRKESV